MSAPVDPLERASASASADEAGEVSSQGDLAAPPAGDEGQDRAPVLDDGGGVVLHPRPQVLPALDRRLVVVEASAGTGKTYFLEHRVVDLILQSGAELPQILVVTFTEKATTELRRRIHDLVDRLSRVVAAADADPGADAAELAPGTYWRIDAAARARLRAAAQAFSQSAIFTIHGFCHRVLLEDAFAANRLFEQVQVADEVAFRAAFYEVLRDTLAVQPEHAQTLEVYLRQHSNKADKTAVERLEKLLLEAMRAQAEPRPRIGEVSLRAVIENLAALASAAVRARILAEPAISRTRHHVERWLGEVVAALARAAEGQSVAERVSALEEIRKQAGQLAGKLAAARGGSWASYALALEQVAALPSLEELVIEQFLPDVRARVERDKAVRGQLDYQDMLVLVRDALRGPRGADIMERLRTRTPWALIDEFQDTDDVQWEIFRTVWLEGAGGGLTVVGDPKQSIYSFRGADVNTYLRATSELVAGGAARVVLTQNHRATEPLVDATNLLLLADPFSPFFDDEIRYDHPVSASGRVQLDTPGLRPLTVLSVGDDKAGTDALRYALRDTIASEIEALRAHPLAWRKDGVLRHTRLSDIFVLTRTAREGQDVAHTLRARGIPCALVQNEHLFGTREALELVDVMAAIATPRDRSARLRALRTRFFDVPWHQLMELVDAADHHPMLRMLHDWHHLAKDRLYERLFHHLLDDSRYAERALVLGSAPRSLVNTQHLLELCAAHVAITRCDIHDLVFELRRWIADDVVRPDDSDVQRIESDGDAVVIQTIHRAKGLEAPVVFVYGGDGPPPSNTVRTYHKGERRFLAYGPQEADDARAIEAEAREENKRLCYVAMTRAQLRLYLPLLPEDKVRTGCAVETLQHHLRSLLRPVHAARTTALVTVLDVPASGTSPPFVAEVLESFAPSPPPPERSPLELSPWQRGLALLSYSRLAAEGSIGVVANTPELPIDEEPAPDVPEVLAPTMLPPGADAGLFLHDVLERVDLDDVRRARARGLTAATWAAAPSIDELLVAAARQRRIELDKARPAAELIYGALTRPLAVTGALSAELPPLVEAELAREVEFLFPLPARSEYERGSRGFVKGYLDVLARYGEDLWVVDYKSDWLGEATPALARQRVEDKYLLQARLYAVAAQRMVPHGHRLAGLVFLFLRHHLAIGVATPPADLAAWHGWLAQLEVMP